MSTNTDEEETRAWTSCEEYGHLFLNENGDECSDGERGWCRDCGEESE